MKLSLACGLILLVVIIEQTNSIPVKDCLRECGTCVQRWGKELYNGALCAHKCIASRGNMVDTDCKDTQYHLIKRGGAKLDIQTCKKYCVGCVTLYGKRFYDGLKCANNCVRTKGMSVDPNCADSLLHTLRK